MTSDVRYREAGAPPREMSKRIAGLVRSFHNVPRLSVGLLAASCVCHALLLLLMTMHETGARISLGHAEPFYLAVVSLGFSFAFLWVKTRSVFRLLVLGRLATIVLFGYLVSAQIGLAYLPLAVLVCEVSVYEPFPQNLISALGSVLIFTTVGPRIGLVFGKSSSVEMTDLVVEGVLMAITVLLGVAGSMMIRYRNELVHFEERNRRLNTAIDRLTQANIEFQEYAETASQHSAVEERKRLSREIHDTVGYTFTNLIMMMEAATILAVKEPGEAQETIKQAREMAESGFEEIRSELRSFREIDDDRNRGLRAIQHLIQVFETATQVVVRLEPDNLPMTLGYEIDSALYHLVQEGLTNAFKHGSASRVEIMLWHTGDLV